MNRSEFRPAWWLPGPHLQTLWGRFLRRTPPLPLRHERWATPDGDVVDAYRHEGARGGPQLLILHGLEGGLRSHYARGMLATAAQRGWSATLLVFRSCGPEPNRLARFYHSGDTGDARLAVARLAREAPGVPLFLVGVSLGGNVLLRYLAEEGEAAADRVTAAAAISVPFDLARSARHIQTGFARVYERHFVRSLKRKALAKLQHFRDAFDATAVRRARTLADFDDVVTAPLHGFSGAADYYEKCSSLSVIGSIRVPTMLISAENDPFLPADVLHQVRAAAAGNEDVQLSFVPAGGHVGFIAGSPANPIFWGEARAFDFFETRLMHEARRSELVPGGAL